MKIAHSTGTNPIYELSRTLEVDLQFGDDTLTFRIELFCNTERAGHFRCHVWELEMFRLQPRFPSDENDEPADISDDILMVDRGLPLSRIAYPREEIMAADIDAALEIVLNDLKSFLEHSTMETAPD